MQQPEQGEYLVEPFGAGQAADHLANVGAVCQAVDNSPPGQIQHAADGNELDIVGKRIVHEVFLKLDNDPVYPLGIFPVPDDILHAVRQFGTEEKQTMVRILHNAVAYQALPLPLFDVHQFVFPMKMPRISEGPVMVETGTDGVAVRYVQLFVYNLFHRAYSFKKPRPCKNTNISCKKRPITMFLFCLFLHHEHSYKQV